MTNRERFIRTLKCEPIGGQVPTFELVFFLTMEALAVFTFPSGFSPSGIR